MNEEATRRLAEFLRARRERIGPAEVGLPAGPRRRAPGLLREEVAMLAGLSPTWYAYLEQGRDVHPSAAVIDSLARVLRLSEDERRYLHVLARGSVEVKPMSGDLPAEEIVKRLVAAAEHSPYPVYGVNAYGDMIAWNRAATTYYTDFGRLPAEQRNMIRWLLVAPEARDRLPEWHEEVHDIVARWRGATAAFGSDARIKALVAELKERSPEFRQWWASHEVRELRSRVRRFEHPVLGEVAMRLIVVRAPEFWPCLVAFHVPAGDAPGNGIE